MTLLKNKTRQLNIVFIIILALYPLIGVNQGLSVMDTTYSLGNFAFFDQMNGTWMVATFGANFLGDIIMKLPFGNTMLGVNVYTSLLVSLTAVTAFLFLKRDINPIALFIGEIMALSLCWCATTILYNYLTYFLFTIGAMVLYRGLCIDRRDCFMAAGIILGLNVGTRFPNITEAALILSVWYVGFICHKRFLRVLDETLMCLVGYIIGFAIPYATIVVRFTPDAYRNMIHTLFAMTDKAQDYKPTSMITAMFGDYIYAGKWIALLVCGILICALIYLILEKINARALKNISQDNFDKVQNRTWIIHVIKAICSLGVVALIVRICYGQGMFSFRYYEYGSMYYWAVMLIATSTVMSIVFILIPDRNPEALTGPDLNLHRKKIMASIVLIMTYVTCLGSNNAMYPIVNNLFVVAPFVVWVLTDMIYENVRAQISEDTSILRRTLRFGSSMVIVVIVLFTLIQGIGFHLHFALQDGDEGQPRNSQITGHSLVEGIKTTETNAANLQGLMDYVEANGESVKEVILYGDVPGLGYILQKSSALTTFWPDLDSYTYYEWKRDLGVIDTEVEAGMQAPYVITSIQVAAWEGGDETAIEYWGVNKEEYESDQKLCDLLEFLHHNGYKQVYCNDGYSVYYIE